jgi:hypothetical protein
MVSIYLRKSNIATLVTVALARTKQNTGRQWNENLVDGLSRCYKLLLVAH